MCDSAVRAYGDGYYQPAIDAYQTLLARSQAPSAAAFYNLGNALLLAGHPGEAVLNYRRAERLAPRDQAVRNNLAAAISTARASVYASHDRIGWTDGLTPREWTFAALAALGGGVLFCAMLPVLRRRRGVLAALLLFALATAAVTFCGATRRRQTWNAEAVVIHRSTARLAPSDAALGSFECPEGSIALALENSGGLGQG